MHLYRIGQSRFIEDISGEGARLFGGRWSKKGIPLLYTAESRSLAALEILVHVHNLTEVLDLSVIDFEIEDKIGIQKIENLIDLPENWKAYPENNTLLKGAVERWIIDGGFILRVPSAIVPNEYNFLINPRSSKISYLKICSIEKFEMGSRLLKN